MCAAQDPDDRVRFRRAEQPTPHLFIGGSAAQLESALPGEQYSLQRLAGRLYATFASVEAAQRAHELLSGAGVFNGFSEFLAPSAAPVAAEAEAELEVPAVLAAAGLRLYRDFVTETEEARVLEAIDAPRGTARSTGACSTTASDLTTRQRRSVELARRRCLPGCLRCWRRCGTGAQCHGPRRRRPTAACRSQSTSTLRGGHRLARGHALRLRGRARHAR